MSCAADKVLNPQTGRCVSRTGRIGRALLSDGMAPERRARPAKPCPPGRMRNPNTGRCMDVGGRTAAKLGYRRANTSGASAFDGLLRDGPVKIDVTTFKPCKPGKVRNPATGRCVSMDSKAALSMGLGRFFQVTTAPVATARTGRSMAAGKSMAAGRSMAAGSGMTSSMATSSPGPSRRSKCTPMTKEDVDRVRPIDPPALMDGETLMDRAEADPVSVLGRGAVLVTNDLVESLLSTQKSVSLVFTLIGDDDYYVDYRDIKTAKLVNLGNGNYEVKVANRGKVGMWSYINTRIQPVRWFNESLVFAWVKCS